MRKKGFTLIELLVAMGIFTVITSITVGAFALIINLKFLSGNIRELNQKVRYAVEIITRLGRQSERAVFLNCPTPDISLNCKRVDLYFGLNTPNPDARKFTIDSSVGTNGLKMAKCIVFDPTTKLCNTWGSDNDLLKGAVEINSSSNFTKVGGNIPLLQVYIAGDITNAKPSPFLNNSFQLENDIVMESLR